MTWVVALRVIRVGAPAAGVDELFVSAVRTCGRRQRTISFGGLMAHPKNAIQRDGSGKQSHWVRVAIVFQVVLAAYLQIAEWIPLGRWNNIANGNGQETTDFIIAVVQITILVFFWRRLMALRRLPMHGGCGSRFNRGGFRISSAPLHRG